MTNETTDKELQAMSAIIGALEALDDGARIRVFEYVEKKLGMIIPRGEVIQTLATAQPNLSSQLAVSSNQHCTKDIRTLKEEKGVRTAIQMAALVAFYLSEVASGEERKDSIGSADVTKYFKQANFPLPGGGAKNTLNNTKNAGYLDATGERGSFKLNPVGYNLINFGVPSKSDESITRKLRKPKKSQQKKRRK